MYSIEFSQTAHKQLEKLESQAQGRIISALERCRIRPYPHVQRIVGSSFFRLRAGHYRAIMDIREDRLMIFVIEIGHRRDIYRKV
ncbi:cytotoxic translational repressor of toxin-antitoxin stability system [Candidatus Woesearchaeota archaeon CG10_big_fil_rev_8_21_14_0_10_44_13]|nr:MAG: cytotoxic translational repressor of toxin-antitoxin stability system [Candidatus Woesearchaeota archaeon CG10_big_fil_rev_8_21_14_0_10_44_13]